MARSVSRLNGNAGASAVAVHPVVMPCGASSQPDPMTRAFPECGRAIYALPKLE